MASLRAGVFGLLIGFPSLAQSNLVHQLNSLNRIQSLGRGCILQVTDRDKTCSGNVLFSQFACQDISLADGTGTASSTQDMAQYFKTLDQKVRTQIQSDLTRFFNQKTPNTQALEALLPASLGTDVTHQIQEECGASSAPVCLRNGYLREVSKTFSAIALSQAGILLPTTPEKSPNTKPIPGSSRQKVSRDPRLDAIETLTSHPLIQDALSPSRESFSKAMNRVGKELKLEEKFEKAKTILLEKIESSVTDPTLRKVLRDRVSLVQLDQNGCSFESGFRVQKHNHYEAKSSGTMYGLRISRVRYR